MIPLCTDRRPCLLCFTVVSEQTDVASLLSEDTFSFKWENRHRANRWTRHVIIYWLCFSRGCSDLQWSTLKSLKQCYPQFISNLYFTHLHHVSSVADGVSRGSLSGDDGELLHLHLPASGIIGSGRKQEVPALLGNANKQWHCLVRTGRIRGIKITLFLTGFIYMCVCVCVSAGAVVIVRKWLL